MPNVSFPVPVTLLTGFLGAGKTTLLNRLLHGASDTRFVVVENEFGDVGIDGSLVDAPADAVFALNEGCVCCAVREDLVALLGTLHRRSETFDHVIIEASGLADPGPVTQVVERLQPAYRLDGVVTVVDARHEALDQWLGRFLARPGVDVLRVKGVLAVPGRSERFVFQVVRDVLDVRPDRPWGDEPRANTLVFIGRNLDAPVLQHALDACTLGDERGALRRG